MMEIIYLSLAIIGGYYLYKKNLKNENISDDQPEILSTKTTVLKSQKTDLTDLYIKHGIATGLDWMLLRAIAVTESSENPSAVNRNDPSYGLMQILYKLDADGNPNKFYVNNWPPHYTSDLFDPDYSLHIGSQILAWNIKTYGYPRGIAVYNAWEARKSPLNGPFPNQDYVDRVLSYYDDIKRENGMMVYAT